MAMNTLRSIQRGLVFAACWSLLTAPAWARCAMCKANIAHAENAAEVSPTVNAAVLVLLIPTLLLIGGLIKLVLKYRHAPSDNHYVNLRSADAQRNSQ
jgi:heme/copper-type cytochrome/quinol oxidase subunit 2